MKIVASRFSSLAIMACTTEKSMCFSTFITVTSLARPSTKAPFAAFANVFARVMLPGSIMNSNLAAAAEPSTSACERPSRLMRSPMYSSTRPRP